jgi:hypothetical protein
VPVRPGEIFHVPGNAPHAWRNGGDEPAEAILVSTTRIGRFFRELAGAPGGATVEHLLDLGTRYGYWNATPEENAAVGIRLA